MNYLLCLFTNNIDSIIVGIFTLVGAVLGVFLANYYNRKAENNRRKMEIKAFLQAICTELNILWEVYGEKEDSIGKFLENKTSGVQGFREIIIPAPEIYFIIYKSNANLLGKIKNDELRKLIASVYLHINEMCNSFKSYNNLLRTTISPSQQSNIEQIQNNLKEMKASYLEKLKKSHEELKEEWQELMKIIKVELGI